MAVGHCRVWLVHSIRKEDFGFKLCFLPLRHCIMGQSLIFVEGKRLMVCLLYTISIFYMSDGTVMAVQLLVAYAEKS